MHFLPDVYIPCAGPPCFLDEKIFPLNFKEENTFPTQADVYNYLKDDYNTVLLLPGDEISIDDDFKKISKINLQAECYKDKKKYLKNYYKKRKGLIQNFVDNLDEVEAIVLMGYDVEVLKNEKIISWDEFIALGKSIK